MKTSIIGIIIAMLVLYMTRVVLMISYYLGRVKRSKGHTRASKFSVLQPIVSGDSSLEDCLRSNVEQVKDLHFVWVVDHHDQEAIRIVEKIKKESKVSIKIIIAGEIPATINEKVWKQKLGLDHVRDYFIAVDDDAIITYDLLDEMKERLDASPCVITGLPYYRMGSDFLTNLVVGFVNGNTLLTYLVMAKLGPVNNLNGMYYFAKKATFESLDIFEQVKDKLSDEYEIAKVLKANKVEVIQDIVTCEVGTTIDGFSHYVSLMKRWMVFVNIYMRGQLKLGTLVTIVIPTVLPLLILVLALMTDPILALGAVLIEVTISGNNYFLRRNLLSIEEPLTIIGYELFAKYLQPFHYLYSLIQPRTIIWRKNRVSIGLDGSVTYKKVGHQDD